MSGTKREARLPLLGEMLASVVREGDVAVIDHRGRESRYGDGSPPHVEVRFHDRWLPLRIALNPSLAAGEAYMDGGLTIERGDIRDLLYVVTRGYDSLLRSTPAKLAGKLRRLRVGRIRNSVLRSRRNAKHHYDLPPALFDLFLDRERIYSAAYFPSGGETLEEAQAAKLRHIAAKLLLEPGSRVLDIGCGWGSTAIMIAKATGAKVKGITLADEQYAEATRRAARDGIDGKVEFEVRDYREEKGRYDRIVSVGMLEHVGRDNLEAYFAKIAELLEEDGVALVHSIGRADGNTGPDPWTDKYIFPGGHIPSLSEVVPAVEKAGLWITDLEILRLHYAFTLEQWYRRFRESRARAAAMLDERFCRMWEFYLASAEMSFRHRPLMNFQIQLARRRDAVPLTRDYIAEAERAMAEMLDLEREAAE
ncbi:MAG: class I SAM-dependent methyltransferase [Sphingomonadaceae bacterium]